MMGSPSRDGIFVVASRWDSSYSWVHSEGVGRIKSKVKQREYP
jgi:hypothetical protein